MNKTERINTLGNLLIGASIVGFGLTRAYGRDYPVIMLDNGAEIAIQSDEEGNNGGTALVSDFEGNTVQLAAHTFDSPPENSSVLVGMKYRPDLVSARAK